MLRLVNDTNGFTDRYTTNMGIISPEYYPPQDTRYVGYWTTIRFRTEYDYTDFVNNRFFIEPAKFDPEIYNYKNDGDIYYFRVLRFDLEKPFKAILCTERNEVIVTDTPTLQKIIDLESRFLAKNIVAMRLKGRKYVSFNVVQDEAEFFDSYMKEEVHIYPIQNDDMFGLPVMIEYDTDLKHDSSYNEANLHTFVDPERNEVVDRDNNGVWRYVDNGEIFEGEPVYWWNNQFTYTPRMTKAQIQRNTVLGGYPVSILRSFDHYYNVHDKSIVDKPRRHKTLGTIIRIDVNATEPQVVVMEYLDTGYVRFICQDEARFFYNTSIDKPNVKFNILKTVDNYKLTRF